MNEHVHEWDFSDAYGEIEAIFCRICDKTLSNDEAKALMNAAEQLSALVDKYYSVRGKVEPSKSDTEGDRILKDIYFKVMKEIMESE